MFAKMGIWEIILILAIALVVFGGGKIAGVGPALGKAIRGFKDEMKKEEAPKTEEANQDQAE